MNEDQFLDECLKLCREHDYDFEAFETEFDVSKALEDGLTPEQAVDTWHAWLD